MSGGSRCCFGFLVFIAQILLNGVVGLVLFWVIQYHSKADKPWPFSWKVDPDLEFNLHPFLMIMGFIYFMGQCKFIIVTLYLLIWILLNLSNIHQVKSYRNNFQTSFA